MIPTYFLFWLRSSAFWRSNALLNESTDEREITSLRTKSWMYMRVVAFISWRVWISERRQHLWLTAPISKITQQDSFTTLLFKIIGEGTVVEDEWVVQMCCRAPPAVHCWPNSVMLPTFLFWQMLGNELSYTLHAATKLIYETIHSIHLQLIKAKFKRNNKKTVM